MEEDIPLIKNDISAVESTPKMNYGYVIIQQSNEEILFEDIWRYFGYEQILTKDKISVDYTNGNKIYDVDTVTCDNISVCEIKRCNSLLPAYFYHKLGEERRFYIIKTPDIEYGWITTIYKLDMKPIFNECNSYKNGIPSRYNCIYTYKNNTIFSLIKIRESREISNFLVAYNPTYLDENEATFILKTILTKDV